MSLYRTCSFCLPIASLSLVYHPFPTFRLPAWNLNPRVCNYRFDISCVFCFPIFLWFLNSASSYDHSQLFPHNGEARLLNSPSTLSAARDSCIMSERHWLCRTLHKMKTQDSLFKNIKHFKMVTTEHETKDWLLLEVGCEATVQRERRAERPFLVKFPSSAILLNHLVILAQMQYL